ncbi:MAG: CapA family protein [Clostridia bacterium]
MSKRILIGGDVVPLPHNYEAFSTDAGVLLQNGLAEYWCMADARIFNLEVPLTDRQSPIQKCGPALSAPTACAAGLAALKPTCVSLCNNHIMDQGVQGLVSTATALGTQGVACFGAGKNAAEADGGHTFMVDHTRVTVYALCEHEFSAATETAAGANALDELELADRIRTLKQTCDYLIVLYHGGREQFSYPSPRLQKRCRKMTACGADFVVCQHSHCIGCSEIYGGGTIVYGQGNFLFAADDGGPCFATGLLIEVTLDDGKASVDYLPLVRKDYGVALAAGEAAARILGEFSARSAELINNGFVLSHYRQYAKESREKMLKVFLSGNVLLKAVNVLYGRKPTRVYRRQTLLAIQNTIACESLNELMTEGLE